MDKDIKVVIAADSFKGSASTIEVEECIERGINKVSQSVTIIKVPVADGGEGTVDALVIGCKGAYRYADVTAPQGNRIKAKFGIIHDNIAVLEMAEASGLALVDVEQNDIYQATTYGTGELIRSALDCGVKEIYIGIGGSATNDGGVGMAQALGVSFKNADGNEIPLGATGLENIETIDVSGIDHRLRDVKITVLSDVTNPLCGENGASYIYGPQKGASKEDVKKLDASLLHYGETIRSQLGIDIIDKPGAGAAGGLGAGLMAFCDAESYSGIEKVLSILDIESHFRDADLVITGEGRIDAQSLYGKAPVGIARMAKKYNLPVIAIVGSSGDDLGPIYETGIDLILDIVNKPMQLAEAIANAETLITNTGESAFRAFLLSRNAVGLILSEID